MSLKEKLTEDMKAAMKAKEGGKKRLSVIRMVRSSLKNVEISKKHELTEDEVIEVSGKLSPKYSRPDPKIWVRSWAG